MSPQTAQALMALSFAGPSLVMGLRLLQVWRDPMAMEGGRWVQRGMGMFIMEFILLQAGVVLGATAADPNSPVARAGGTLLLTGFFALFALAIAAAFRSGALLSSFLGLVIGRWLATMVGVSQRDQDLFHAHAVLGLVLYMAMVAGSVVLPWPRLGITAEVATQTRLPHSSGLWVEQPHRAIGPAAVYFLLLGLFEACVMSWVEPGALIPR